MDQYKYRLNEVIPNNLNDFGSYKLMLKEGDIEKSNITNHNDIIPKEKIKSIDETKKLIQNQKIQKTIFVSNRLINIII